MKRFGIVLLPDAASERFVVSLSKKVRRNQIVFGRKARVHLSLLHIMLRARQFKKFHDAFLELQMPGPLVASCYEVLHQKSGWRFVEVRKNQALARFQKKLVPLTRLRSGDTDFTWKAFASPAQKRAHTRWGYPNIGAAWPAHFTFGKTEGGKERRRPITLTCAFERIALVEIGENGTAGKILVERKLKSRR